MSVGGSAASGAASGALAGAAFGPWGAAIGGVVGGAAGFFKGRKAKKETDAAEDFYNNNKWEIPTSAKAHLSTAERMASGVRMPAEDLRMAQLGQITSQGVGAAQGAATSASDVQAMLAQLYGNQQVAQQGMAIEGAQRYDENQKQLMRAQSMMAGYEDIEGQYDMGKYNQMLAQNEIKQQQRTDQMNSIFGAASSFGAGKMQMDGAQGRYDSWHQQQIGNTIAADPRQGLQTTADPLNDWKNIGMRTELRPMPFTHPRI